jgi:uncharacterized OB-fold protein
MTVTEKPVPRRDGLNGEFYSFTAREELRFQKCDDCGSWRHMPRHSCARCHSTAWSWQRSSGRGKLYSWNVNHRSFHPGFNADVPYCVCVIEMEEGVRLISQLVDINLEDYRLDLPVEVVFVPRGDARLPMFRPRTSPVA